MAVTLKYGILCDYAAIGARGKAIAMHIFEHFRRPSANQDDPLPAFAVLAKLECSIVDGDKHTFTIKVIDEDAREHATLELPPHPFAAQGPGMPMMGQMIINISGVRLPFGAYEIVICEGSTKVGRIGFRVLPVHQPGS